MNAIATRRGLDGKLRYRKTCAFTPCGRVYTTPYKDQETCSPSCGARRRCALKAARQGDALYANYLGESTETVERMLAAATARRKRHEAVHGRTYTIDPWQQRPGAGEVNFNADLQGEGWA